MLRKKEKVNFYTLLIQQAQCTVDGVKLLCAYCANPDESWEANEWIGRTR